MQLILIRHALPQRAEGLGDGERADPDLTDLGIRQAKRLPEAIGPSVDALYSSPMARALATAAPLAAAVRRDPVVVPDLREFDAEHNQYLPVHEMARDNPEAWQRMLDGQFPIPVDTAAFGDRVGTAIEEIIAQHPGRATVVLVAHAGVINIWLARLLGLARPLTFPLDYAGITRVLAGRDGRRIVRTVNETGHVADLLALPGAG